MADVDQISPVSTQQELTNPPPSLQNFYDTDLLEVPPEAQKLLESYSHIPSDEVMPHILNIRDEALKSCPSHSIATYRFLDLALARSANYPDILSRLQHGHAQFLDLGCGLGSSLRQLVQDGVSSEHLYGADINPSYFPIGYDLYRDAFKFNALFLGADLFDHSPGSVLKQLEHKVDIIWTSNVLDLFGRRQQVAAIVSMLKLLKPAPDTMLAGHLIGHEKAGEYPGPEGGKELAVYRHDKHSFKKMFHEACDIVGEKWETEVTVVPWKETVKTNRKSEGMEGLKEVWFFARKLSRVDGATSHKFVF
ncbi:hypothetical protein BT63DRAFT_423785 [Microthyrium microscopicum]|uniref:Methyltransferase domain-containing protein n=1 Tax=Microthyrium microscopicum TaxID=703497 RepID=A0A6A6UFX8_9PEZI|nr:hypothetical protein BT63DRAFT_423785 [Microthyrium microscopicum]